MNYVRIYDEFIEDRKRSQPLGISERHHIIPRYVGGSDSADNLIDLSPADHFFAHLLLARIYGGRLWVPVVMWCGGDKGNWRARKSRLNYEWAAKAAAKHAAGKNAWQYDPTQFDLEHIDGRRAHADQMGMLEVIGGTKSGINFLLKGRIKSYRGWFIAGNRPADIGRGRAGGRHHMADPKIYHWVHLDGTEFRGTRVDFCGTHGVSKKSACLMVNGQQVISKGWTLHGAKIPTIGGATHRVHQEPRRAEHSVV